MKKLAICTPYIGVPSETFIRRHMVDLSPERSVVLSEDNKPPQGGQWKVESPVLLVRGIKQNLRTRALNVVKTKLGLEKKSYRDEAVRKFLLSHSVDVILGEYLDYSLRYLPVALKLGIPLFAHAHGYDVSLNLRNDRWRKEYLSLNESAGVVTMSEYSRRKLLDIGIKAEKIHVVPYGIVVPEAAPRQKENAVRVLAVGRMVAKKAPILLLDSFRRAAEVNPDLKLDFVGAGPFFTAAQHYVSALGLESKVTLHGVLDNLDVLKLMKRADIFVQHSVVCPETGDEEGIPVAILEAMAYGLPVVSTWHAGIPEAVKNEETGLLVKEGDTISMGAKLVELARQPQLRAQMGATGRARVQQEFSWEKERDALRMLMKL